MFSRLTDMSFFIVLLVIALLVASALWILRDRLRGFFAAIPGGARPETRVRQAASVIGVLTLALVFIGLLAITLFANQDGVDFRKVSSVAGMLSGASLMVGVLIGFIFGIPRALTGEDQQLPDSRTIFQVNTNLEQVSDWLTKIIVGLVLTQLGGIPDQARSLAAALGPALGGKPESGAFGVSLATYYLLGGFFIGYLATRIFLPGVFQESQSDLEQKVTAIDLKIEKIDHAVAGVRQQVDLANQSSGQAAGPKP